MEVLKKHLDWGHLAQKSTAFFFSFLKLWLCTWEREKFHTITQLVEHPEKLKQRALANVCVMEEGGADARTC